MYKAYKFYVIFLVALLLISLTLGFASLDDSKEAPAPEMTAHATYEDINQDFTLHFAKTQKGVLN